MTSAKSQAVASWSRPSWERPRHRHRSHGVGQLLAVEAKREKTGADPAFGAQDSHEWLVQHSRRHRAPQGGRCWKLCAARESACCTFCAFDDHDGAIPRRRDEKACTKCTLKLRPRPADVHAGRNRLHPRRRKTHRRDNRLVRCRRLSPFFGTSDSRGGADALAVLQRRRLPIPAPLGSSDGPRTWWMHSSAVLDTHIDTHSPPARLACTSADTSSHERALSLRIAPSVRRSDRGVSLPTQDVLVQNLSKESQVRMLTYPPHPSIPGHPPPPTALPRRCFPRLLPWPNPPLCCTFAAPRSTPPHLLPPPLPHPLLPRQDLIHKAVREHLLPFARRHYPHLNVAFDKQPYPRPGNLFIVRYSSACPRPGGRGLKLHKDETALTFNM